ncbi:MAG: hypothetical protein H6841_06510 [Planctomycetes bacterium]|nr:hypothetical protein [Planctomycetota bacterium]MCB9936199.1 hypothetical protein [Planctomycetota bacterium]
MSERPVNKQSFRSSIRELFAHLLRHAATHLVVYGAVATCAAAGAWLWPLTMGGNSPEEHESMALGVALFSSFAALSLIGFGILYAIRLQRPAAKQL